MGIINIRLCFHPFKVNIYLHIRFTKVNHSQYDKAPQDLVVPEELPSLRTPISGPRSNENLRART